MKTKLLFICLLFLLPTFPFSQTTIEFKTIKPNVQTKTVKQMMIAGMGNSPARMFLERLSEELSKNLKKRNVTITYQFLGSDPKIAGDEFSKLQATAQFDAILVIFQSDTTKINKTTTNAPIPVPLPWRSVDVKQTKLLVEQKFKFKLYEKNSSVSFWDAMLNLYAELSDKTLYPELSLKITTALQQNLVL